MITLNNQILVFQMWCCFCEHHRCLIGIIKVELVVMFRRGKRIETFYPLRTACSKMLADQWTVSYHMCTWSAWVSFERVWTMFPCSFRIQSHSKSTLLSYIVIINGPEKPFGFDGKQKPSTVFHSSRMFQLHW